jgi:hypothetical protein
MPMCVEIFILKIIHIHIYIKQFYFMLTYIAQTECDVYYLHVLLDALDKLSCLTITNKTHM